MWQLPCPKVSNYLAVRLCCEGMQDVNLADRLLSSDDELTAMSDIYYYSASVAQTHSLDLSTFQMSQVTQNEMVRLYSQGLVGRQAGRRLYDTLLLAPEHERCPFCRCDRATTLDHFLPKETFPGLAVDPINLVPACKDCNVAKLAKRSSSETETILHPYFDQLGDDYWLQSSLVVGTPPVFRYRVQAPASWDDVIVSRIRAHFKLFGLPRRYSLVAGSYYSSVSRRLARAFQRGGRRALEVEIREDVESAEADHKNSWQAALFRALQESDWFLDGGALTEQ